MCSDFVPHRRRGLTVLGFLVIDAALGLGPAIVFKAVIDHPATPQGHVARSLLVAAKIGAVIVGGLISVGESYVTASISQDIGLQLRKELFQNLFA
jgi:hypothetical protein